QTLHNGCETLLQRFFESLYILKPRASYSFQAAANALSSVIDDANEQLSALKKTLTQVTILEQSLAAKDGEATKNLEEIKRLKADSDSDRKTIADYLSQATQERTSIRAVSDEASNLQ